MKTCLKESEIRWKSFSSKIIVTLVTQVLPSSFHWETCAEIPYWWRVTIHIWVVLLIGHGKCALTVQKHYSDLGSGTSSVRTFYARFSETSFRVKTGGIAKYGLFSWFQKWFGLKSGEKSVFLFKLKIGQASQILSLIFSRNPFKEAHYQQMSMKIL